MLKSECHRASFGFISLLGGDAGKRALKANCCCFQVVMVSYVPEPTLKQVGAKAALELIPVEV